VPYIPKAKRLLGFTARYIKIMEVYKKNNSRFEHDDKFYISNVKFEEMKACTGYDYHGQPISCYDAGCHCIDNDASDFNNSLLEAIDEKFHTKLLNDLENSSFSNIKELAEITELSDTMRKFIKDWIQKNTNHSKIIAYNYFGDNNWKTISIYEDMEQGDLMEMDEKKGSMVLKELEGACFSDYEYGISTAETENYDFSKTLFQDDWWSFTASEKT